MQRGLFTFGNYLTLVVYALVFEVLGYAALVVLLAPQLDTCFCPVQRDLRVGTVTWRCCQAPTVPSGVLLWVVHAFPFLCAALMALSLLVAVVGFNLEHTARRRIDVRVVYALKLCPLLTVVFLGMVALAYFVIAFWVKWASKLDVMGRTMRASRERKNEVADVLRGQSAIKRRAVERPLPHAEPF
jgi:hypothetical protein